MVRIASYSTHERTDIGWVNILRVQIISIYLLREISVSSILLSVSKTPASKLSNCVATHLSKCVVITRLSTLNQGIKQVFDFGMLINFVTRKPSH